MPTVSRGVEHYQPAIPFALVEFVVGLVDELVEVAAQLVEGPLNRIVVRERLRVNGYPEEIQPLFEDSADGPAQLKQNLSTLVLGERSPWLALAIEYLGRVEFDRAGGIRKPLLLNLINGPAEVKDSRFVDSDRTENEIVIIRVFGVSRFIDIE
jgi:hypothetical protein